MSSTKNISITENTLQQTRLILTSYYKLLGEFLVLDPEDSIDILADKLYNAPFVVLSHNTAKDPIFNYANLKAQDLFEMDWDEITNLPSRYSAEAPNREERAKLLHEVSEKGYINNYSGIRIAKSQKRFRIEAAVVWNMHDDKGIYKGQAATFSQWTPV